MATRPDPKLLQLVGTTTGLAGTIDGTCGPEAPEQVYVRLNPADPNRPVIVEGWVGYSIDQRMAFTPAQARELVRLLTDAVLA